MAEFKLGDHVLCKKNFASGWEGMIDGIDKTYGPQSANRYHVTNKSGSMWFFHDELDLLNGDSYSRFEEAREAARAEYYEKDRQVAWNVYSEFERAAEAAYSAYAKAKEAAEREYVTYKKADAAAYLKYATAKEAAFAKYKKEVGTGD